MSSALVALRDLVGAEPPGLTCCRAALSEALGRRSREAQAHLSQGPAEGRS